MDVYVTHIFLLDAPAEEVSLTTSTFIHVHASDSRICARSTRGRRALDMHE